MHENQPPTGGAPLSFPSVTLILGGARSGKSTYAQRLAERHARVLFLATATASDDEMRAKIDRHRADRPQTWTTVEEPLALARVLRECGPQQDLVLIDCLTLYAAHLLHQHGDENAEQARLDQAVDELCDALAAPPCAVLLVSNEVGSGVVPAYALGRRYRDLLGELNQRVAAVATDAVLMVAGLPLVLKSSSQEAA
jgi:adenosylcobinamide kinase/adenosylcobinamide-phosphate guanylyltransferase